MLVPGLIELDTLRAATSRAIQGNRNELCRPIDASKKALELAARPWSSRHHPDAFCKSDVPCIRTVHPWVTDTPCSEKVKCDRSFGLLERHRSPRRRGVQTRPGTIRRRREQISEVSLPRVRATQLERSMPRRSITRLLSAFFCLLLIASCGGSGGNGGGPEPQPTTPIFEKDGWMAALFEAFTNSSRNCTQQRITASSARRWVSPAGSWWD